MLSRIQQHMSARSTQTKTRRFRDMPVHGLAIGRKRDVSPVRLVGYFVGGILLANLVLMTSSVFLGHAAPSSTDLDGGLPKRGPLAAAAGERALGQTLAPQSQTDARASHDGEVETRDEPPRPLIANLCADAREKLISGLTIYYLQRSRRPNASNDEVMESASASALLAGPSDPAALASGTSCAG